MRIHTNTLTALEVRKVASLAAVDFTRFDLHGSRSHEAAFDIILSGHSGRRQNFGGPDEAASWDQWGIFLGTLYRLDPSLKTPYYASADEFNWRTGSRFTADFTVDRCHVRHAWEYAGGSATGSYSVVTCSRGKTPCGAIQRWMLGGRSFEDLGN